MDDEQAFPVIRQTVLDTTGPRRLAEFYRQLFGLRYRPGDEPPGPGQPDPKGQDWLVLKSPADGAALAFQKVGELPEATWPDRLVAGCGGPGAVRAADRRPEAAGHGGENRYPFGITSLCSVTIAETRSAGVMSNA
jgi:hypothetical protein